MADYKLFASRVALGEERSLSAPCTIHRYTDDAYMGLEHIAADTANSALTSPGALTPRESESMGPGHNWTLGYQGTEGFYEWTNGAWQLVASKSQPATVGDVFTYIEENGGGTLHWLVYHK